MLIFGYIYKITNINNNRSYIGLTVRSIEERWKEHLIDASKLTDRFHIALNRYGEKAFTITELEKCPVAELNEKEIYYIAKYDTYVEGYNATKGGGYSPRKRFLTSETMLDEIVYLYVVEKYSSRTIAANYNVDKKTILNVLKASNIQLRTLKQFSLKEEEAEELILRYKMGESLSSLAKDFDVASSTIKNFLSKRIELNSRINILEDSELCKQIVEEYVSSNITYAQLMKKYNTCYSILKKILKDTKKQYRQKLQTFNIPQTTDIILLYTKYNRSIRSIAKEYNVDFYTIKRLLERSNVLKTV